MRTVNGTDYRFCLLDTNAVSEMVKEPASLRHFIEWSLAEKPLFVPAFSPFTIIELHQNANVYRKFIDLFGIYPCEVLKGYEQLLEEEVRCYPNPAEVDPWLLTFSPVGGGDGNRLGPVLDAAFRTAWIRDRERHWIEGQMEIVEGMRSLVPNYPPAGATYTPSEIRTFLQIAGLSQLVMRAPEFVTRMPDNRQEIDIDAFPSLKITLYTAFQKFYTDRARRPSRSDAFDIIISTGAPYVEAIITENHQAEALRQIQRRDTFIKDLLVFTLKDFRHSSPVSASIPV
jgi:hypothetical protein